MEEGALRTLSRQRVCANLDRYQDVDSVLAKEPLLSTDVGSYSDFVGCL